MNYFGKHWRGELDLSIAFWINLVLFNIILRVFSSLSVNIPFLEHPQTASRFAIFFLIFTLGLYVWQIVGTWRCSRTYKKKTNKTGFAYFTQFIMVLGVISTVNVLRQDFTLYKDAFEISFGKDEFSDYSLTISEDGSKIYLQGGFGFDISKELEDLIKENPGVDMVVLESQGGWVYEGQKVSEAITNYNLDTATLSYCESACTLAFISGKSRYISQGANLGFHAFSTQVYDSYDLMVSGQDPLVEWTIELFQNQRVSEEFIDTMFQASNEDMWYPTLNELLSANVVGDVVTQNSVFKNSSKNLTSNFKEDFAEGLIKTEFYKTLKQYEPDLFQSLLDELILEYGKGATQSDLIVQIQGKIREWTPILLKASNDKTIKRYAKINVKILKSFFEENPFLCMKFLYQQDFGTPDPTFFPQGVLEELNFVLNEMLVSFYTEQPQEIDIDKANYSISNSIFFPENSPIYLTPDQMEGAEEYRGHCLAVIDLYEQALSLDVKEAGNLLRYLLAEPEQE